jgi:hypothetical protein
MTVRSACCWAWRSPRRSTPALEAELLSQHGLFATREQARHAVVGWIDEYNTIRRHSTAQMMPPVAYELAQAQAAARTEPEDKAEGRAA